MSILVSNMCYQGDFIDDLSIGFICRQSMKNRNNVKNKTSMPIINHFG